MDASTHLRNAAPTTLAGAKIRRWREAHRLTLQAFGEQLDPKRIVPTTTIYNWETLGKVARPRLQRIMQDKGICEAGDWLKACPAGPTAALLEDTAEPEPALATGTG